jgi:hypothetical protein
MTHTAESQQEVANDLAYKVATSHFPLSPTRIGIFLGVADADGILAVQSRDGRLRTAEQTRRVIQESISEDRWLNVSSEDIKSPEHLRRLVQERLLNPTLGGYNNIHSILFGLVVIVSGMTPSADKAGTSAVLYECQFEQVPRWRVDHEQ